MDDTFGKPAQTERKAGTKTLPAGRFAEQTEPQDRGFEAVQDEGRLEQSISIGKKPEVYTVAPGEIESLRPSEEEIRNG
jgi:hypothetical protein